VQDEQLQDLDRRANTRERPVCLRGSVGRHGVIVAERPADDRVTPARWQNGSHSRSQP
jgi:hypothetical protein